MAIEEHCFTSVFPHTSVPVYTNDGRVFPTTYLILEILALHIVLVFLCLGLLQVLHMSLSFLALGHDFLSFW